MISALKKLTSNNRANGNSSNCLSSDAEANGIQTMSESLQKKFSRGVHYNMKLLIRGDRSTGKTALFLRLQGHTFKEAYEATEEIKVTAIQWNHKAADDIVKVEVWDVVDRGKKRIKLDGLKISETPPSPASPPPVKACLDAEFVDVYKGAHGVILMFDVTKQWTFDYVTRELANVPKSIPVLVLANFIDQAHHRCVTRDQAEGTLESFTDLKIRYAESSMRNGFGLRFLHKFLSLPYLNLQRESLIQQLEYNKREIAAMEMELDLHCQSEDSDYEKFSDNLTKQRRQNADKLAPSPTVDVVLGDQQPHKPETRSPSATTPSPKPPATQLVSPVQTISSSESPDLSNRHLETKSVKQSSPSREINKNNSSDQNNVDDFVPETGAIDFFLNDEVSAPGNDNPGKKIATDLVEDESGDDDDDDTSGGGNPMVATLVEDIEDDDLIQSSEYQRNYEQL